MASPEKSDQRHFQPQRSLTWGAVVLGAIALGLSFLLWQAAFETHWIALGEDRREYRFFADRNHTVQQQDGHWRYVIEIEVPDQQLELQGKPVRFLLEKGTVSCSGDILFQAEKQFHMGQDRSVLLMESRPDPHRTLIAKEMQPLIRNRICSQDLDSPFDGAFIPLLHPTFSVYATPRLVQWPPQDPTEVIG